MRDNECLQVLRVLRVLVELLLNFLDYTRGPTRGADAGAASDETGR